MAVQMIAIVCFLYSTPDEDHSKIEWETSLPNAPTPPRPQFYFYLRSKHHLDVGHHREHMYPQRERAPETRLICPQEEWLL